MRYLSKPRNAIVKRSLSAAESATILFEPQKVLQGIIYHLLDERIAKHVASDSVQSTLATLQHRGAQPTIQRDRWETMTNPQRLEWLLESGSITASRGAAGVVRLDPIKSQGA